MSGEVEHLVNEMHRDEYDFHYAVCDCGYRSTPVPDIDILIDEMMAHAQRLTPDDLRAAVVPLLDYEAAWEVGQKYDTLGSLRHSLNEVVDAALGLGEPTSQGADDV